MAAPRIIPSVDASDARWLRRFVLRALRASVVVPTAALAVSGCSSHEAGGEQPDWRMPQAGSEASGEVCSRDLVAGMTLEREVDFLADVSNDETLSARGEQCSTARDAASCLQAVAAANVPGRHLLTTEADDVRVWLPASSAALLGEIDVPEEAIWLAAASGYAFSCRSSFTKGDDGYVLEAFTRADSCIGSPPAEVKLAVASDGTFNELEVITHRVNGCAVPGRRPPGLRDLPPTRACTALGAHFARAAQLEAASVPAFAQIARELVRHRAPEALIAQAARAQRDETRHARLTTRLARRFGAEPRAPRISESKSRPLFELALDNATEGCVFETYAALEAAHQAKVATDREVRLTMASVAGDEIRHAAFSHALHAFACARLRDDQRDALVLARKEAVARLHATLSSSEDSPSLCVLAGVPTRRTALGLHAALSRTLWA